MKKDLRVIERRSANEFELTAQDRRIEKLVQNVNSMNASQVEMEIDLEHLNNMTRKQSMHESLPIDLDASEEESNTHI